MKTGFIYGLIDPETDKIRYIGQTIQTLHKRLTKHHSDCERNNRHVSCWLRGLKTKELKAKIVLLEECNIELLDQQEIFYIKKFKDEGYDLTNISEGGQTKRIISQETKDKISNSLKGHKQSEETKLKRKNSVIETWKSPELRTAQSERTKILNELGLIGTKGKPSKKKGKPFSGNKEKLSSSLKEFFKDSKHCDAVALKNGAKPFLIYKVKDKTNKDYSLGEFIKEDINKSRVARELNLTPSNICNVLDKKTPQTKGYIFIYK